MSADFEVEMVLFGKVLLRTRNLPLVREFLTAATAILARPVALGTRTIHAWDSFARSSFYSIARAIAF